MAEETLGHTAPSPSHKKENQNTGQHEFKEKKSITEPQKHDPDYGTVDNITVAGDAAKHIWWLQCLSLAGEN